jgi:hypothetical protein
MCDPFHLTIRSVDQGFIGETSYFLHVPGIDGIGP